MNILVIGGNRFFGKTLVQRLLEGSHKVTLLNRGKTDDGFGDQVRRIKCDRRDKTALIRELHQESFDLIYDQVCFDQMEASAACEVFKDRTKRYVFTSTQSVYPPYGRNLKEGDFRPEEYQFRDIKTQGEDYGEAKRQAEATFFQEASFSLAAVRFPIVIGVDDPTERFQFHLNRIEQAQPLYFPNLDAKISLISKEDAAKALEFIGQSDFVGPINAASPEPISLGEFLEEFEKKMQKHAILSETKSPEAHSPYGLEDDWYMDCGLLRAQGLELSSIKTWLPNVIEKSVTLINS